MEYISIGLTILSFVIWIVGKFSGGDSSSSSSSGAKEYFVTANLTVPVETIKASGIDEGEAVMLKPAGEMQTISVMASGTSWTPVHLGNIIDHELFGKVSNGRAKAKIFAINGDIVTIEFKYI